MPSINPNDTKTINSLSVVFKLELIKLGNINDQPSMEECMLDADIETEVGHDLLMGDRQYSINTYKRYIEQVWDAQHYFDLKRRDESTNENPF